MSVELIERLEKATGPDRELDLAIALATGWTIREMFSPKVEGDVPRALCNPAGEMQGSPDYTGSIDEALTLAAPLGWSWRVGNLPSGTAFADLGTQKSLQCVEGATPAIALCIAALKARGQAAVIKLRGSA